MKISRTGKVLVALLAVVMVVPAAGYMYIGSGSFNKRLANKASEITGDTVELTGKLSLVRVFPELAVSVPNVKIRASGNNGVYQRMRLEDVELTLSHDAVTSGGQAGEADLTIGRTTVINAPATDDDQGTVNVTEQSDRETLALQINNTLKNLRDLTVSVELKRIDVIARAVGAKSTRHRAFNTRLLAAGDRLEGSGQFVHTEDATYLFGFKIPVLSASDQNDQITGDIDVQAELVGAKNTKYELSSGFEITNDQIKLAGINYKKPGVWLRGDLSIDNASKVRISGSLEARLLELTDATESDDSDAAGEETRIFSEDIIDMSSAKDIELDLRLIFGAVRVNRNPIISGVLNLAHKDGKLTIESEDLYLLGGDSDFTATVQHAGEEVAMRLKLAVNRAQLRRLQVGDSDDLLLTSGAADLIIALKGKGESTAAIARSLSGYVTAAASDAEVNQQYVTAIDRGVVSWAKEKISLLAKRKKVEVDEARATGSGTMDIQCASLKLFINDGRVEVSNGAILEFPDNTLVSSGYVDLHTEKLGFVFRTKSRSLFDWSALSIIKFIEVGGALNNPSIALDSKALAKQGLLSSSSIVFGPVPSLVYTLAEAGIKNRQKIQCVPSIQ